MTRPLTRRANYARTLYACWKRQAPRGDLDARERQERDYAEAWDLRNEALADRLDAYVGRTVALTATRQSVLDDVYVVGTRLRVVARASDMLLGEMRVQGDEGAETAVILLSPLWIEVVNDDEDDDDDDEEEEDDEEG